MGYDGVATLAIPLVYVYTAYSGDFHVKNPSSLYSISSGNDNKYCGPLGWPC
jgi:hypothetical protein